MATDSKVICHNINTFTIKDYGQIFGPTLAANCSMALPEKTNQFKTIQLSFRKEIQWLQIYDA